MKENFNIINIEDAYLNPENQAFEIQPGIFSLINNKQNHNAINNDLISKLDDAFEAIAEINDEGSIVKVNKAFTDIFGYSDENILGTKKENLLYPEDQKLFNEMFELMVLKGKARTELRLVKKDGSICFGKVVLLKNTDIAGRFAGHYFFMEDISARLMAEKSLKNAQNFLESTLNSLTANVAIIDGDGAILAVNRAWTAFALQNEGDLKKTGIGSNYLKACEIAIGRNSEEGKAFADGLRKVLNGEISEYSLTYPCHSILEKRWFFGKVSKFIGEGSRKAVVIHTDITKNKLAEIELAKSEEKFRSMVQNAYSVITVIDSSGNVKYVSPSNERIIGHSPEEMYSNNVFDLVHPDDLVKVKSAFEQILKNPSKPVTVEYWIKKDDGNYIYMESIGNNLLLDPNVQGIVINSRDITDRKYAEEKMQAALNEKGILLKEIHHRVKNNLQIVTSLLKLQENHIHDESFKKVFHESIGRVKAMSLIHQGLYQENSLSHIDFGNYMRSIMEFLKEMYDTQERNIECEVISGNVGFNLETAVPCGLIVNELVSNALKHAFPGDRGGKLFIKLETDVKHILTISDNGVGIPENVIFNKAKTLGLSLVNTLAEQLGALIEIDNTNGTTFKITFENLVYKERVL